MEDVSKATIQVQEKRTSTKQLVSMAMLAAISIILVSVIHFPIFPAAPFLEYDPADIPILIGTLVYGPVSGFLLTVVVSFIQGMTVSAGSGIIGIIMHIVATGSCTLVAGMIYQKLKSQKSTAVALTVGALTMTMAMGLMNLILTPIFMGTPIDAVLSMMIPVIVPFNLIKSSVNCVFTYFLFRSIIKVIERRF